MKTFIFKLIQVGVILGVGQIPFKNSTIGAVYVDTLRMAFTKFREHEVVQEAKESFEKMAQDPVEQPARALAEKNLKNRLKVLVAPEDISQEESEAVKSLLERE
ncbi:hypothetical protein EBR03_04925 [bacterium]|nr:hypothetical protein [bacterium]NBX81652.1 hypothetical protein [bacterium]